MNQKNKPFEYFHKPIPQIIWQILIISPAILVVTEFLGFNYLHLIGAGLFLWAHQIFLPKFINELRFYKNKIRQILKRINPLNLWNSGVWEGERKEKKKEKNKYEETLKAYEKARQEQWKKQEIDSQREKVKREEEKLRQEKEKEEERIRQEKIRREKERKEREKHRQQEEMRKEEIREEAARRQREWDRQYQERERQERTERQKPKNKKTDQKTAYWWEGKDKSSLKSEWKRLAKIYHPDNGTSPDAEIMKKINAEYDLAKNRAF